MLISVLEIYVRIHYRFSDQDGSNIIASRRVVSYQRDIALLQCYPANPAQAGEEAVGLADLSGLPSSFCVLVGE